MAQLKTPIDWALLLDEISWSYSRSSGPGGQHTNKTASKVQGVFQISSSRLLSEDQKELLRAWLVRHGPRYYLEAIDTIQISGQTHRSQKENREELKKRFMQLFAQGLTPPKKRKRTVVPGFERKKRLLKKRKRSLLKLNRQPVDS